MANRTLLIEHDTASITSVIDALKYVDVTIDVVHDVVEGLLILHEHDYDMLMINIMPNDCNGMEIISHVTNRFPKLSIIAYADSSSEDFESDFMAAKACGATYCFTKPLPIEQIVKITRQTLTINPET
jgi:DNA-binding NtrC family response regulator